THTAPSSLACLGTNADPNYVPYLREKLAEAIAAAEANLEPAKVGWGSTQAPEFTALRRWILRPDRLRDDPFGNPTVRANMHAGRKWEDVVGESGPEDPQLSMISIQSSSGRPLALLANFSMHYFSGDKPLSADYFGRFAEDLQNRLGSEETQKTPFVAIMSHGCSGDIWRKDYTRSEPSQVEQFTIEQYAQGMADLAFAAYQNIEYQADVPVKMAEARMTLNYRVPNKQLLEWSQRVVDAMGDRLPKTTEEVYAREQLILHERQSTEIAVQGLRIGDIGIASTPNETYALTGLKIKLQSPLEKTMVIELANGGDGYIPPPEQHMLGGYNTWAARSAGLEVTAEPKIAEQALELLERVTGENRRPYQQSRGEAVSQILTSQPDAYWRLDEMSGLRAIDATENHRDAILEPPVAFFLAGPASEAYCGQGEQNRSAHFAGGRLSARIPKLNNDYTVVFWCWNGMPTDAREVAGWMFSRGRDWGLDAHSEHLGLGGVDNHPGKLIVQRGDEVIAAGKTTLERWQWYQVALVRSGDTIKVFLNGA
ncbi:MAG: LamG domain-containing protein, partial [Planctomycetes bacterium]|nr:LamG domain-containing protein [Planctomycetota bacterium]